MAAKAEANSGAPDRAPRMFASRLLPFAVAGALSIVALAIAAKTGVGADGQAMLAARYTARVSFAVFLVVYLASSLWRLRRNELTRTILRRRRQWGLAFALSHTIHLAALAWFTIGFQHAPRMTTLLGGGLGYALMFAMVLTSNDASQRMMGIWWKRLHTAGIHWLWFIFAFSYLGRILGPPDMRLQGMILFPVALAAIGLRLVAARRS
ncbi:MAG: hypothetical protein ABI898_12415 [Sphingomonadales bacterium]